MRDTWMNRSRAIVPIAVAVVLAGWVGVSRAGAPDDFVHAVATTHPVAYYRLDALTGKSQAGTSTYKAKGGVSLVDGPPIGVPGNQAVAMNGKDGYVLTTQAGGVGDAASFMAWVKLDRLASTENRILYVAGESEYGNDLDLQFEQDDSLRFFTAAGGHLTYMPDKATLANHWHMIVATLNTDTHTRVIYWDGVQVAKDEGGGKAGKKNAFSIGESTVFHGRWFPGAIDEVGLWNRALTAAEVTAIYKAAGQ